MMTALTAPARSSLLDQLGAAVRDYDQAMNASRFDEAARYLARVREVESAYFTRLPRLIVASCPFDSKPLHRSFDPFGFDGAWWRSDSAPPEAATCPHFCFFRGAVNLNGKKPHGGDFPTHIGPQVPYVIPRILQLATVVAVLSQLDMANGHIAYLISYFAEKRPPAAQLAANWPRTLYTYTTALAEHRWRTDSDAWDFDLRPWLENGKLRWCPPGQNAALSSEPASQCPYLDLSGERQPMVLQGDHIWGAGLPQVF